ncbi:MAG: cytochrome c5 family protein [Hyphomonadaceae bacterium]
MRTILVLLGFVFAVAACEANVNRATAAGPARLPADARIAGLYTQSCQSCHTDAGTRAPLTGDRRAWDPRWNARGLPGLVRNTVEGYNAMPAGGACVSCTAADYEALIRFMAGREGQ